MTARKKRAPAVAPPPPPTPVAPRPRWWILVEAAAVVAVLVIASNLLFSRLGESSFHDGDEALYASVAREMTQHHAFLTPTYWGTPFLHKPPLPYWLMSISSATVPGSREFGARFPSALAALLLLALVYLSTRRLAGAIAALFATSLLAVNPQFLFEHAARSASFDALLAFLMFGALVAGLKANDGRAWRIGAVVLLGLVALVKAPMVIFPGFAIVLHAWMRDRRFPVALMLRGLAGVAIVALPWHLYQLITHGSEFWNTYVMYEIFGRVGSTVRDEASVPQVHLAATWWSFLPWSPFVVVALIATIIGRPWRDAVVRTIGVYAASILVFFCFIPSKWPWYSIPAYPALAVVTATFLRRWYDSSARRTLPVVLAVLAVACAFWLGTNHEYEPAARPSYLWPAHEPFYVWGASARDVTAIALSVAALVLALMALRPWKGRALHLAGFASVLAVTIVLGFNLRAVRAVPQSHTSAVSRLANEIEQAGITHVLAFGFVHQDRYAGRPEPLSSYYLLGIRNAQVVDCAADVACIDQSNDESAALVVWGPAMWEAKFQEVATRALARAPGLRTWIVQSPQRYEELRP